MFEYEIPLGHSLKMNQSEAIGMKNSINQTKFQIKASITKQLKWKKQYWIIKTKFSEYLI